MQQSKHTGIGGTGGSGTIVGNGGTVIGGKGGDGGVIGIGGQGGGGHITGNGGLIVGGDGGDNILSVVKFTKEIRGIGDVGADSVWKMYKEKFPQEIDFDSNNFIERLCDILSIYRKNKELDFRKKVAENIRKSRIMTRLDNRYLPDGLYKQLLENVKV